MRRRNHAAMKNEQLCRRVCAFALCHLHPETSNIAKFLFILACAFIVCLSSQAQTVAPTPTAQATPPATPVSNAVPRQAYEYLWYEAENMRGFSTNERHESISNSAWLNLPRAKVPGWGINGPGVSAEWSQGGESEWNAAAASADETGATIYQDIEVPRAGLYRVWARYADWAALNENFTVRVTQNGREVFVHEFGTKDVIDSHDEVSLYWQWVFTWDSSPPAMLAKGSARISINIEKAAEARRHVDCVLITNDLKYVPEGRRKPEFAALRYLREWSQQRTPLAPLFDADAPRQLPAAWRRPPRGVVHRLAGAIF